MHYHKHKQISIFYLALLSIAFLSSINVLNVYAPTYFLPTTGGEFTGDIHYGNNWITHNNGIYMPWDRKETIAQKWIALADSYGGTYESIGTAAVKGWDILLFKFGNPNGGVIMMDAQLHGNEYYGHEALWAVINWLLTSGEANATRILQKNYILVVPVVNYAFKRTNFNIPTYFTMTATDPGNSETCGINLNRNFANTWSSNLRTSNSDSCSGDYADSESESQALINVWNTYHPRVYINFHQGSNTTYAKASSSQAQSDLSAIRSLFPNVCSWAGVSTGGSIPSSSSGTGWAMDGGAYRGACAFLRELGGNHWDNSATRRGYLNSGSDYKRVRALFIASSRVCESGEENSPPVITAHGCSSTMAGASAVFSSHWTDDTGVSQGIFGCNVTSIWVNETAVTLSGTSTDFNVAKILPSAPAGKTVYYRFWVKDINNTWTVSGNYSILTTGADAPYYSIIGVNTTATGMPALFYSYWHSEYGVQTIIYHWNGTTLWTNTTIFSGSSVDVWGNISRTIPVYGTFLDSFADASGEWQPQSGTWIVENGILNATSSGQWTSNYIGAEYLGNVEIKCDMYPVDSVIEPGTRNHAPGIIFRYKDNDNFAMAYFQQTENRVSIGNKVAGVWSNTHVVDNAIAWANNNWYNWRIVVDGQTVSVYINGTLSSHGTIDASLNKGKVGVEAYDSRCYFDNFYPAYKQSSSPFVIAYQFFCEDTLGQWAPATSITYFTVTPKYYYFDYTFQDLDSNPVYQISADLYNGTTKLDYSSGSSALLNGTYILKTHHHDKLINQTSLNTIAHGDSLVTIKLPMKQCSSGYMSFNNTITSLSINSMTNSNLTITITGSSPMRLIFDVPQNASYMQRNGVNLTGWKYFSDGYFISYNATTLSTYSLIFSVSASYRFNFPSTRPLYLTCYSSTYIIIPTTINAFATNTFSRDSSHKWNIGDYWITTTKTLTINTWFSANWLNYTVTGAGTQQIYNGTKPASIYIDGILKNEGDGWTYASGTVTITAVTSSAWLTWSTTPELPSDLWPWTPTFPPFFNLLHVRVFVTNGSTPLSSVEVKVGLAFDETSVKSINKTNADGVATFDFLPGRYFAKVDFGGNNSRIEYFTVPFESYVLLNFGKVPPLLSQNIPFSFWLMIATIIGIVAAGVIYMKKIGKKR